MFYSLYACVKHTLMLCINTFMFNNFASNKLPLVGLTVVHLVVTFAVDFKFLFSVDFCLIIVLIHDYMFSVTIH